MTNDVPLNLSDLVHGLSPEPQFSGQNNEQWPEEDELQAVDEEEMERIRMRVSEFSSIRELLSDREKELIGFIERLSLSLRSNYTQDQLLSQASTISSLLTQRDFLLREREEEHERWEGERLGWDRIAEALIRTKTWGGNLGEEPPPPSANSISPWQPERDGYSGIRKPEETLNPQLVFAELDNKELRQKLSDTQQRLTTLESQLTNLRPLLLIQPSISRTAYAYPSSSQPQAGPSNFAKETRGDIDIPLTVPDERPGSPSKEGEGRPFPIPATYQHYRNALHTYPSSKRRHHSSSSKKQSKEGDKDKDKEKTKQRKSAPLTSDARAEHLLLAAKRLGRERAFVLGGIMQLQKERRKEKEKGQEREKEREKEKEGGKEKEVQKTPKTPRTHGTKISLASLSKDTGSKFNHTPGKGIPVSSQGSFQLLNTPTHKIATGTPSTGRTMGTPLDSLLSAARMMDVSDPDDEDNEQEQTPVKYKGKEKERKRGRKLETPESPVPKRRRTTTATSKDKDKSTASNDHWDSLPTMDNRSKSKNAADAPVNTRAHLQSLQSLAQRKLGGERVRSALDVLADQAAAYSSNNKGKGRADAAGWGSLKPVQWHVEGEEGGEGEPNLSPASSPRRENIDVEGRTLKYRQVSTEEQVDGGASTERPGPLQEETTPTQTPRVKKALKTPIALLDSQEAVNGAPSPVPASASDTHFSPNPPPNVHLPVSVSVSVSIPHSGLVTTPTSPLTSSLTLVSNPHPNSNANLRHTRAASIPAVNDSNAASTNTHTPAEDSTYVRARSETVPGLEIGEIMVSFDEDPEMEQAINRDLERVGNREGSVAGVVGVGTAKKTRSPYVKWSQEEDDLLAQAVARYGQKWDLVQKALPTRGYHQVRQRWLRKLGVFDTNLKELPPEVGLLGNTNIMPYGQSAASGGNNRVGLSNGHLPPQPRLGLAPLSSELALNRRS